MGRQGIPTEGVALVKAYPLFVELLEQHPSKDLSDDVRQQLRSVHVASQILHGKPSHFQFMAYPIPRLTFEERQVHPLSEEKTIEVQSEGWKVAIDIDLFGHINWFYVDGIPELYDALRPYLPMG